MQSEDAKCIAIDRFPTAAGRHGWAAHTRTSAKQRFIKTKYNSKLECTKCQALWPQKKAHVKAIRWSGGLAMRETLLNADT